MSYSYEEDHIRRAHINLNALRSISHAARDLITERHIDRIRGIAVSPEEERAMRNVRLSPEDPRNVVAFRKNRGGPVQMGPYDHE